MIKSTLKNIGSAVLISLAILTIAFWGVAPDWSGSRIYVEDFVGGSDFEILQVNLEAVERAKHGAFVTVVPHAYVSEGNHTLTVGLRRQPEPRDRVDISFNFERGKRYRIATENGKPKIVIDAE